MCVDEPLESKTKYVDVDFPRIGKFLGLEVASSRKKVSVVKLWQIADVKQGLATADDELFIRKTPEVIPNARRRNIKNVDMRCTANSNDLSDLEKLNGVDVTDYARDKYYVPFDKGGEQDIAKGELRSYWSPVDYWIDWSKKSVGTLETRNSYPSGTPKKPRLQNRGFYFKKGIRFAVAGLYAPTFELSHGGVFGHKGSLILPIDDVITKFLLGVLCSSYTRYLTKSFLQHTVMTEIDIIRQIPIVVPNVSQFNAVNLLVDKIIESKKNEQSFEHYIKEMDILIYDLYGVSEEDQKEVQVWLKRKYPNLGRDKVDLQTTKLDFV